MIRGDETLSRGLLLALAEYRRQFSLERFHATYQEALKEHGSSTTRRALEEWDPVFGINREAERMLVRGERDMIISWIGNHRYVFLVSDPTSELVRLFHSQEVTAFRKMGKKLHEGLGT